MSEPTARELIAAFRGGIKGDDPTDYLDQLLGEGADMIERLLEVLDAARICLKNRDQSQLEARVYVAICTALEQKVVEK